MKAVIRQQMNTDAPGSVAILEDEVQTTQTEAVRRHVRYDKHAAFARAPGGKVYALVAAARANGEVTYVWARVGDLSMLDRVPEDGYPPRTLFRDALGDALGLGWDVRLLTPDDLWWVVQEPHLELR